MCSSDLVEEIAAQLEANGGRMSVLLQGVVESPAFQRQRVTRPDAVVTRSDGGPGAAVAAARE